MTLVPPVTAAFTLEQSCFGKLRHSIRAFAGSFRPPQALSLRTAAHPSTSSVIVGFEASTWLRSPINALHSIPGRHVTIAFRTEVSDDGELSAWDVQSRKGQYDKVLNALWEMDLRELRVLRIDGLRWWGDQKQLFQERAYPFPPTQDDEAPLFARAWNVEVLILTARSDVSLLEALTELPAARNKLLFPRLHTIAMEWPRHESVSRSIVVDLFQKRHAAGLPVRTFQVLRKGGQDERWEDLLGFTQVVVHDSASE
ncbi:hypothetical protein PENSPDRAFT_758494 [Peniophora sp. CONT]|nr:hypothetical protein PENSPDRAFT_758494 [Peniophora sp. CONT]